VNSGLLVLLAAVLVALGLGIWRAMTDGRFRGTRRLRAGRSEGVEPTVPGAASAPASVLAGTSWAGHLGERATLLQFSSAFCAPCRTTRHLLADVASRTPGVVHVEVDAEHNLPLVRRVGILRTPTTVVLDELGREVMRASGAPRREQVVAVVAAMGSPE
jgi:thiol-disulfide isomerase/thioredoxin